MEVDLGSLQGRANPCCCGDERVQIGPRPRPEARLARAVSTSTPKLQDCPAAATWPRSRSRLGRARPARLELAALALEDEPVRPGVAHVADPVDERVVRLDHLERVLAVAGDGHGGSRGGGVLGSNLEVLR